MAEENFREFLLAPFNPANDHYNEEIPELNPQTDEQPQHGRRPRRKRNSAGNPDPNAEVVALPPEILMATNRFVCEVCNKGFQRDQNLQLHRRGHNLPWKLRQRPAGKEVKKKVYVCPEETCVHHDPSRALGDLTGIKKHYCRKHGLKKLKCEKCNKIYAVVSDWKAHMKICGIREYKCECDTIFSRKDSYVAHRVYCEAAIKDTMEMSENTQRQEDMEYPHQRTEQPESESEQERGLELRLQPDIEMGFSRYNTMEYNNQTPEQETHSVYPIYNNMEYISQALEQETPIPIPMYNNMEYTSQASQQEEHNYTNCFDTNAYSTPSTHNDKNNDIDLNLTAIQATPESPSVINYGITYPCSLVPTIDGGSLLFSQASQSNNNNNINLSTISTIESSSVGIHPHSSVLTSTRRCNLSPSSTYTNSNNGNINIASIPTTTESSVGINYGGTHSHSLAPINTRGSDFFSVSTDINNNANSDFTAILATESSVVNNDGTYPSSMAPITTRGSNLSPLATPVTIGVGFGPSFPLTNNNINLNFTAIPDTESYPVINHDGICHHTSIPNTTGGFDLSMINPLLTLSQSDNDNNNVNRSEVNILNSSVNQLQLNKSLQEVCLSATSMIKKATMVGILFSNPKYAPLLKQSVGNTLTTNNNNAGGYQQHQYFSKRQRDMSFQKLLLGPYPSDEDMVEVEQSTGLDKHGVGDDQVIRHVSEQTSNMNAGMHGILPVSEQTSNMNAGMHGILPLSEQMSNIEVDIHGVGGQAMMPAFKMGTSIHAAGGQAILQSPNTRVDIHEVGIQALGRDPRMGISIQGIGVQNMLPIQKPTSKMGMGIPGANAQEMLSVQEPKSNKGKGIQGDNVQGMLPMLKPMQNIVMGMQRTSVQGILPMQESMPNRRMGMEEAGVRGMLKLPEHTPNMGMEMQGGGDQTMLFAPALTPIMHMQYMTRDFLGLGGRVEERLMEENGTRFGSVENDLYGYSFTDGGHGCN